jgi:DNA-binding transcriptional ArsR family regulator
MIELSSAVSLLTALAYEARLDVFRLLVKAGREGIRAGEIGRRLSIAPTALSFHLNRLREAGLVSARRDGRRIVYAADFDSMRNLVGFLTEHCCAESPAGCTDACPPAGGAALVKGKKRAPRNTRIGAPS